MKRQPVGGGTWTGLLVTLAGIALAVAAVLTINPLNDAVGDALRGDHSAVRDDLNAPAGVALVVALAALHAFVFYPAEILDAAAGFVYGLGPGFALVHACWIMNGLIAYAIGRNAARPLIHRLVGAERFERMEERVERGGTTLLIGMRLIPLVPFSLFSYAAGAARVKVWTFTWTTAVGYAPLTLYFTYLGSRLEGFSIEDPVLWAGAVGLIGAMLAIRLVVPRVHHHEPADAAAPAGDAVVEPHTASSAADTTES